MKSLRAVGEVRRAKGPIASARCPFSRSNMPLPFTSSVVPSKTQWARQSGLARDEPVHHVAAPPAATSASDGFTAAREWPAGTQHRDATPVSDLA